MDDFDEREREIAARSGGRLITRADAEAAQRAKDAAFEKYATSKSVSQSLLNTSAIQFLIVIVVALLRRDPIRLTALDVALLVLIAISLVLQFTIFVFVVILAQSDTEQVTVHCTATSLNNAVTMLSGALLIVTSAISVVTISTGISSNSTTA